MESKRNNYKPKQKQKQMKIIIHNWIKIQFIGRVSRVRGRRLICRKRMIVEKRRKERERATASK